MYITVKTIKRNLGFKGIELNDILIGFPMITIFVLMFALTSMKIPALVLLVIGVFLLLPISVSKKNRMYKILILVFEYIIRTKTFIYSKKQITKEGAMFIDEFKKRIKG